ncbi:MAG: hypothetical protein JEZ09_08860 [Salinivirgaceae bacterium]|nr:hypothetical protein [Salinivirgaceae bacterium]
MELFEYKNLLEKYYEGNSTTHEEELLKEFVKGYRGNDEEFLMAKHMFNAMKTESKETVAIEFDSIVKNETPILKIRKPIRYLLSGLAASLLVGIMLTVLLKTSEKVVYAYVDGQPIYDEQVAIEQSKKALLNISSQFNKGTKGLSYVNKMNKPVELLTVKK